MSYADTYLIFLIPGNDIEIQKRLEDQLGVNIKKIVAGHQVRITTLIFFSGHFIFCKKKLFQNPFKKLL